MKPDVLVVTMRRIDIKHGASSSAGAGCTIILITPSLLATNGAGPDQSGSWRWQSNAVRQLQVLSDFLHGLDLAKMHPDYATVKMAPGVVVRGLSEPGRQYAFISMDEVRHS